MEVKVNLSYRFLGESLFLPVQQLRVKIEQELEIPTQRQILTNGGRLLYGLISWTPTSVNQFLAHVNIAIQPPTGMLLPIKPDHTILQIKNRLHQTFRGIPPNMFKVIDFQGHELLDLVTLHAYSVRHLSCIHAVVRGSEALILLVTKIMGNQEYLGRISVRYSVNDAYISPAAASIYHIVLDGQLLAVHAVVARSENVEIVEEIWFKYKDNEYPLEGVSYTFG